ncbi:AMIN domain-containing protein [Sulfurimonas sp. HSL1-6]|uniref:AMIN domain-containing protein n=1 Tax=Thiomicrolovo immobilis TaxID=3131935 RepID=UPI0031F8F8D3
MKFFLILLTITAATLLTARDNPFLPSPSSPEPLPPKIKERPVKETVVKEAPVKETHSLATQTVNFQQARFLFSEGNVRIESRDKLAKHFVIRKPTRIILDFEANADFPTRKREVSVAPFKEIRMGMHPGYYRIVIELEKRADYSIEPSKYGYTLTLK